MKKQEFKNSEIKIDTDVFSLHYFPSDKPASGTPVLISPPHAGRHANIAQNLINACVDKGKHVYTFELKSATQKTKDISVSDLIAILYNCQSFINNHHEQEQIDILGLCQGAWLSAIYTAHFQERVSRYANFAGPINTKTGQVNSIEKYCKYASMYFHKKLVDLNGGIQPGLNQWLAFAMVKPSLVFFDRWFDLGTALIERDLDSITKWYKNNNWYDQTNNLAGKWFLDCLQNHFVKNKLFNGTWEVCGQMVDLGKITCPVYLYGGALDEITHHEQVFAMANKISTPKEDIHMSLFKGAGHTKVFTGASELEYFIEEFFVTKDNQRIKDKG